MSRKILITGGAGFIGSHLVDTLIDQDEHDITVLDVLEPQVHDSDNKPPDYLNEKINFIHGSITDYDLLKELVNENEVIFHLSAMVGVGQSMYQVKKYSDNNIGGTANLLDILANSDHEVKKVVIASSNTVYGEGKAKCKSCGIVSPSLRTETQLKNKNWEINCPKCGLKVKPNLTDENMPFNASSIYAFSKQAEEEMGLMIGNTYGIDTTILRFFLVYGPRQSIRNPYTGVVGIFSTRLFLNKPPIIFEDGLQSRDFVNVKDVCQALLLSMEKPQARGEIFNVASGKPITIRQVAEILIKKINPEINPKYTNQYRVGDIRHCLADISKIKNKLGYEPKIEFEDGIEDVIKWIKPQIYNLEDKSEHVLDELNEKGLLK